LSTYNEPHDLHTNRDFLELWEKVGVLKVDSILSHVTSLLEKDNDEKYVVFVVHSQVADSIENDLISKNVCCMRLDITVSMQQKMQRIDQFNESGDCRVAIVTIPDYAIGISLCARHIVFAELHYHYFVIRYEDSCVCDCFVVTCYYRNAEDRIHQIGCSSSDNIIDFIIAQNTLDEHIWKYLNQCFSSTELLL
jgi:hypothetical protein